MVVFCSASCGGQGDGWWPSLSLQKSCVCWLEGGWCLTIRLGPAKALPWTHRSSTCETDLWLSQLKQRAGFRGDRGKRDGYSCLWSCRRMAWLLGELCADFPLCRNEGQQEEDAWPLGWWCAAEGWPEHWKALQVPIGTAQHLLACCRFTSAQLCWVPMAALLGVGPKMGLRCSCCLSAGKEGRPHSAGTRRWHSYCNLCKAAALE